MSNRKQQRAVPRSKGRWIQFGLVLAVLSVVGTLWMTGNRGKQRTAPGSISRPQTNQALFAKYAGSQSCRECHQAEHALWSKSHHAAAERLIDPARDQEAFDPERKLAQEHGETTFALRENRCEMTATGINSEPALFLPDRVLGVAPLYQFLVPFPGGRWQMTQAAFDPARKEWFDIFNDDRRPGEWGHWTGRGMNWNSMCAACHNTMVRKNYDWRSDTYATAMAEMGVSCEACHGPRKAHVEWRRMNPKATHDPTVQSVSKDAMLSTCGSCHARRSELTGNFKPGDSFFDHYALSIPDESELFYPDGQVRDEDFEFTSFLSSKMHTAGVRCGDCHEPHSGKTLLPGNMLCMRCHAGTSPAGVAPAPKIEPLSHSRHKQGSAGNQCVECHMPHTTFMQRHARRDHGFTLPDPVLTKRHGIPNACNRCHKDQTTDWAVNHFARWYGDDKDRPSRKRAETIAKGRAGQAEAVPHLLQLAEEQPIPLWRAVAITMLKRWTSQPDVLASLVKRTADSNPLVRAMAARGLENQMPGSPAAVRNALEPLLQDPVRSVRVETAWALRSMVNTNSLAGADLLRWLEQNRDQPGGLLSLAVYLNDRGQTAGALEFLQQAVSWDANSAPIRQLLCISLAQHGRIAEAAEHLKKACELSPRDAVCRYQFGLALNELGQLDQAIIALEKSVELDPNYSPAWYNLGLGYSASGQPDRALQALFQAEMLDGTSARIPYARATVLARTGQIKEARNAAERALSIEPNHVEATELLISLGAPKAEKRN